MQNINKLYGLAGLHICLTNRCNKNCWCCGRRKIDREYPEIAMDYGDMNFALVRKIADQLPPNIVVSLHGDGEPLLYPQLGEAIKLFDKQITTFDTNGKLLLKKFYQIVDNLDTIAISMIENDNETEEQDEIIEEFLKYKGDRKPYVVLRVNGNVDPKRYEKFNVVKAFRVLHNPMGSFDYKKKPTIPEVGICLDFLHHMSIDRKGNVSICVRFDPKGLGIIGDANTQALEEIWNGKKRTRWLEYHKKGRRDVIPLCNYCEYWGIPTGK